MVIVVMGVSGSGKSTVGRALANALGWDYQEGDDLHPQSNIDKMSTGIALTDDDRWPWLDRIARWIGDQAVQQRHGVVTCSALKHAYRDRLRCADDALRFVYIRVPREELEHRLRQRHHFMPASLLESQLQTLEEPAADESALIVPGNDTVETMIVEIRHWLSERSAHASH